MADILFTRGERLALALQTTTMLRLNGDDLRWLAVLVDADQEVDAARSAAIGRFGAMVKKLRDSSLGEWADGLDPETHSQFADDAELSIGLTIKRPEPTQSGTGPTKGGTE